MFREEEKKKYKGEEVEKMFDGVEEDPEENLEAGNGSRTLLNIIGDQAVIDGKFKISQSIDIDCEVRGKLRVDGKLTIQKNGFVNADLNTINAEIIGKYEGNMEASGIVEIKETGIVKGNIKTDSLIINKGGIFSGNVTRITGEDSKDEKYSKVRSLPKSKIKDDSETGDEKDDAGKAKEESLQ